MFFGVGQPLCCAVMVVQIRDLAPIQKLTIAILIFVEGVVVGLSAVQTSADYGITFAADYWGEGMEIG